MQKKHCRLSFTRKLVQLYAALLYNANLKGFIKGDIYTGSGKNLCVPGLNCYSCPGAVGACPLGALQNALTSANKRAPHYILGILLLLGVIFGRTICGWLCPMGLAQELLYKLPGKKIKKGRVTRALTGVKYVLLVVLAMLFPLWGMLKGVPLPGFCKYICPAGTLEGAVALLINPVNRDKRGMLGALFLNKFIWLILILLLCVFLYRAFCRFICPLGAIYSLFARFSLLGVKLDEGKCIHCDKCVRRCKMDIRKVGDRECIHCGECISVCPTRAIAWKGKKIKLAPNAAGKPEKKRSKLHYALSRALLFALLIGFIFYINRDTAQPQIEQAPILSGTAPLGASKLMGAAPEASNTAAGVGDPCPQLDVALLGSSERFSLDMAKGRTLIINFWATWCAPCLEELPSFDRLQREHGDEVLVLAVHSKHVTEDVSAFLSNYDYELLFALDENGSALKSLGGSSMLPMTVAVSPEGVIIYSHTGALSYEQLFELF